MTRALSALAAFIVSVVAGALAFAYKADAETLYAGVSHTETMIHVDDVRKNTSDLAALKTYHGSKNASNVENVLKELTPQPTSAPIQKTTATPATKLSVSNSQTAPTRFTASAAQTLPAVKPAQPSLVSEIAKAAASAPKQGYLPAFGVGHAAEHKVFTVGTQKFSVQWFIIPPFMSGTWQKDGDLTTEVTNLATGRKSYPNQWIDNRLNVTWGHQMDKAGNVWHVNLLPSERDGLSDGKRVRFLTVAQQCEQTNAAQMVTRTHYLVSESDVMNGAPEAIFQQESLNDYMFDPQTQTLVNRSSNRVFSYSGYPVRDGQLLSKYRRIANFTPTPSLMGLDLRQSLADFLVSEGLSNLVQK